jgi:predicted ArsR family transcriptional regulator
MTTNTRSRVLRSLLLNQQRTVNELADAVGINPISVRHHVNKLEAEGLIQSVEERHGVGRPRLVYSLTNKGMEQFPQRWIAGDLTGQINLDELSLKERLELLQEALVSEGFMVTLEEDEGNYYVVEASCPYHHVGENYPEVCVVDKELIAHFAASSPERIECILDGDKQCKYTIKRN